MFFFFIYIYIYIQIEFVFISSSLKWKYWNMWYYVPMILIVLYCTELYKVHVFELNKILRTKKTELPFILKYYMNAYNYIYIYIYIYMSFVLYYIHLKYLHIPNISIICRYFKCIYSMSMFVCMHLGIVKLNDIGIPALNSPNKMNDRGIEHSSDVWLPQSFPQTPQCNDCCWFFWHRFLLDVQQTSLIFA